MIAFSHYSAAGDISGVTTWFERVVLRLHSEGVPVVVLLHHFGRRVQESSLLPVLQGAGVQVEIVPRSQRLSQDIESTIRFLNRHRPCTYLPHCLPSLNLAAAVAGRHGLRWALTVHSDDPMYWAMAESFPPEEHGGELVCVSQYLKSRAEGAGLAKHANLIPYGIIVQKRPAAFSDAPFTVAYTGRVIEEQKRISLVVEAMALACRQDPRIQAVIVGDGPALASARDRVAQLKLSNRIRFLGRLEPHEVVKVLSSCQAILMMSDYEGLPIALLEAMAAGVVPVVRRISSGVPELVQDGNTGILVDDAPATAAAAIHRLCNDSAAWNSLSLGARMHVERHYGDDQNYEKWRGLVERLCDESRVRYPLSIPAGAMSRLEHPLFLEGYPTLGMRLKRTGVKMVKKIRRIVSNEKLV